MPSHPNTTNTKRPRTPIDRPVPMEDRDTPARENKLPPVTSDRALWSSRDKTKRGW